MKCIRIAFVLLALSTLLLAHRVNIFAQVEGDSIIGQCYYSDGTPVRHQKIEVSRLSGEKLIELRTDDDGYFRFAPRVKDNLKIVLNAGMGHKAEMTIEARDLPEVRTARPKEPKTPTEKAKIVPKKAELNEEQLRRVIEEVVEKKINKLRELMDKQQKSISLTTIIGGIGYIFGIFGLIVLLRARRRS